MSLSKMLAKLQSTDNLGDTILDGVNTVVQAVSSIFDFDGFPADGEFAAVVLTTPVQIKFAEYEALGYTGGDIESDNSYYKFKVRIVNKRNNPHAVLADPCDITKTEEVCQQNGLIASHTTIAVRDSPGINIGSYVTIKLDKLPNGTFNLQTGRLVEVEARNDTGATVLNADACKSMAVMFDQGEHWDPPPIIEVDSDIEYLARKYDESPDIPYKDNHKEKFSAYETMNSPFPSYFKALAYIAYDRDLTGILFTGQRSGVRTEADQKTLSNKYKKDLALYKDGKMKHPPLPANAKPGYHGAALAADINVDIPFAADTGGAAYGPGLVGSHKAFAKTAGPNSHFANPDNNKRLWEATNIVKYIKELGMQWGGEFRNYDPVHIQWTPSGWARDDVLRSSAQAGATGGKINYPTKTVVNPDGKAAKVAQDLGIEALEREETILQDEEDAVIDARLLGDPDDWYVPDTLGAVGAGDSYDEAAEESAEQRRLRAQAHDHYKTDDPSEKKQTRVSRTSKPKIRGGGRF